MTIPLLWKEGELTQIEFRESAWNGFPFLLPLSPFLLNLSLPPNPELRDFNAWINCVFVIAALPIQIPDKSRVIPTNQSYNMFKVCGRNTLQLYKVHFEIGLRLKLCQRLIRAFLMDDARWLSRRESQLAFDGGAVRIDAVTTQTNTAQWSKTTVFDVLFRRWSSLCWWCPLWLFLMAPRKLSRPMSRNIPKLL